MIRGFREVREFAADVHQGNARDEIEVRVELRSGDATRLLSRLPEALRNTLGPRASVDTVPVGMLPRFPVKARRFTDHRTPAAR